MIPYKYVCVFSCLIVVRTEWKGSEEGGYISVLIHMLGVDTTEKEGGLRGSVDGLFFFFFRLTLEATI